MGCGEVQRPLAASRLILGFRPQMWAVQLKKQNKTVGLKEKGKEICLFHPHETGEKWKQLLLGWAGIATDNALAGCALASLPWFGWPGGHHK